MRRFVTLAVLLLFTVPFGLSISGCHKAAVVTFCDGGDSGVVVGQTTTITLQPKVYGISLSYGQKGQISSPGATDCKGNVTSPIKYVYGTTDMTVADVNPTTGQLCAGNWNRNVGGGIADYTTCNLTNKTGTAYVTAAADGVTSNPLPVFIHPVVTSIVLGSPTAAASCATDPDPSTNCCAVAANASTSATPYTGNSCLSQGATGQLSARVYKNNTTLPADNISCQVGHLAFSPQDSTVVTIDQNGVATAVLPGSSLITATVSTTPSTAGFFSTCPPVSISLVNPGQSVVNQNNIQPLTTVVKDANNTTLTGLTLEYVSTAPTTIPGSSQVDPAYPGAASITALCMPATCNPSPFNSIGLFGNGLPVSSNPVTISSPGTSGTILFMGSTLSQYLVPVDLTTATLGNPVRLPYIPNTMIITNDGTTIYMGSSTELMVFNATSNGITREDTTSPGTVLGVSPDGGTIAISDPTRQIISLESSAGAVITTYGGVGTHAQWSPDSQTVYITAGSQLLVYANFTGWHSIALTTPALDVAVTVPSVGAYFAGSTTTARSYCPITTVTTLAGQTSTSNVFYPLADSDPVVTDRVTATADGNHILGVTASTSVPLLNDLHVTIPNGACPAGGVTFTSKPTGAALTGVTATSISGVLPTSDSSIAFITYTGTGGILPTYTPVLTGLGTIGSIKLSGTAIAPVAGVFSNDNLTFYTGTTGDNLVHVINRTTLTDSSTINPKLPAITGTGLVVPNLIVERVRKTTS